MPTLPALLEAGPTVTDAEGTLDAPGFARGVHGVAAQLHGLGVGAGDRVALWLPNSAACLMAMFACARLGAVAVHVNTRFRGGEVGALLRRTAARVVVTEWGFAPADFPAILATVDPADRTALRGVLGRRAGPGRAAGVAVTPLDPAAPGNAPDQASPQAPCLTFTTSGTTSGPKLVLHDQASIASHALDVMRRLGLDQAGSVLLAALPLCGTFSNVAAMAAVAGGAHLVCMDRFDADEAAALIRRHRVTHMVGTDEMLRRITEAAHGERFTTMRFFGFGAFQAGAAEAVAAAVAIGLAPAGVYGSSEIQALFSIGEGVHRLDGGGRPVSAAGTVAVRHPETGAPVPDGESGELCFDGSSRFLGYLGDEQATRRATTADGLFRSGDLGHLVEGGFVYEARLGDALRLGGFLVGPEEIEGFLMTRPGVAAAQVVAGRQGTGLVPVAFVIPDTGAAPNESGLLAACREHLARYKVPSRIAVVDAFPVTDSPNGLKVQRVRLRELADALLQETMP